MPIPARAAALTAALLAPSCLSADDYQVVDFGDPIPNSTAEDGRVLGRRDPVTYVPKRYGLVPAIQLALDPDVPTESATSALSLDLGAATRAGELREIATTSLFAYELGDLFGTKLGAPTYLELFAGIEVTDENGEVFGDGVAGIVIRRIVTPRFATGIGYARIGGADAFVLNFSLAPPIAVR